MKKLSSILFAVLLMALAGCGSSNQAAGDSSASATTSAGKSNSPRTKLISAVSATSKANTAHLAMTVANTGTSTTSFSLTSDGVYDFNKKQGQLTATVTSAAAAGQKLSFDEVLDGTTIYEKLPADLTANAAKPWIKIDLNTVGDVGGVNLGDLASGQSSDPGQGLSMLTAASDDVQVVGKENVRGADTTHYKATLDFATAASKETDADRKASLQQLAKLYSNQTVPVDVWLDSDSRVRKISYSIDPSKLSIGSTTTSIDSGVINFSMEFYDFGTPVNLTIPPADQVSDIGSLTGASGGTAAS